ncbi:hypothetical protein TVAGG3_0157190 [Trichomonas vaginalis G3]|uniref:hypothetical protein n=1 Tax=Trichomonas vaginalis (strain ATCC PRA-98 / G3) TaxID=412133 RepID=UPI0021E5AC9F|nr:hypothetical protein TVAGG3_0157190 [Trichomonas vaginalis G3]KAI5547622.1 hypothetical protein TVAGG3_0157190 [Trichomonas vaginalis G3]
MCWKINDMWRQGKQAKWIVDGVEQDFLPDGRRAEDIPDIHIREEGNTDEERESEHSNEEDIDEESSNEDDFEEESSYEEGLYEESSN